MNIFDIETAKLVATEVSYVALPPIGSRIVIKTKQFGAVTYEVVRIDFDLRRYCIWPNALIVKRYGL